MITTGRWKKNPHKKKFTLDLVHVLLCMAITGLALFGFLDVSGRYYLFPLVFFLAAILNLMGGVLRCTHSRGEEARFMAGVCFCALGVLLLLLAIASAYVTSRMLAGV